MYQKLLKSFENINNIFTTSSKISTVVILVLLLRKQRHKEVK